MAAIADPQPLAGRSALLDDYLDGYQRFLDSPFVEIRDPTRLSRGEREALLQRCRQAGMALYRTSPGRLQAPAQVVALGEQFGLRTLDRHPLVREDGVSTLMQAPAGERRAEYIPYTNRPINWHTDGYYNPPERRVRGLILHCLRPAQTGGTNRLLDHRLVWQALAVTHPEALTALQHPRAMTIPPDPRAPEQGERSGPVFLLEPTGLHMRYTARTRSIRWRPGGPLEASALLRQVLDSLSPWVIEHRLAPGEGLVCNNVLHTRTGFSDPSDGPGRCLFRARYHERVVTT